MTMGKTGIVVGAACVAACAAPPLALWIGAGATAGGIWAAVPGELGAIVGLGVAGGLIWFLRQRKKTANSCCEGRASCGLPETKT
jgi:hypothetical protein